MNLYVTPDTVKSKLWKLYVNGQIKQQNKFVRIIGSGHFTLVMTSISLIKTIFTCRGGRGYGVK